MMKPMNEAKIAISILYKKRGMHTYVEVIFNRAAIAMLDSKYPNRTSIDVYYDTSSNQLGFKIREGRGMRIKHRNAVSVTKAIRKLVTSEKNLYMLPIEWDTIQLMYIVNL